jgi:hypothetical protein
LLDLPSGGQSDRPGISPPFLETRATARGASPSACEAQLCCSPAHFKAGWGGNVISNPAALDCCQRLRPLRTASLASSAVLVLSRQYIAASQHNTRSQLRALTWTANGYCATSATASTLGARCDLPEYFFSTTRPTPIAARPELLEGYRAPEKQPHPSPTQCASSPAGRPANTQLSECDGGVVTSAAPESQQLARL